MAIRIVRTPIGEGAYWIALFTCCLMFFTLSILPAVRNSLARRRQLYAISSLLSLGVIFGMVVALAVPWWFLIVMILLAVLFNIITVRTSPRWREDIFSPLPIIISWLGAGLWCLSLAFILGSPLWIAGAGLMLAGGAANAYFEVGLKPVLAAIDPSLRLGGERTGLTLPKEYPASAATVFCALIYYPLSQLVPGIGTIIEAALVPSSQWLPGLSGVVVLALIAVVVAAVQAGSQVIHIHLARTCVGLIVLALLLGGVTLAGDIMSRMGVLELKEALSACAPGRTTMMWPPSAAHVSLFWLSATLALLIGTTWYALVGIYVMLGRAFRR